MMGLSSRATVIYLVLLYFGVGLSEDRKEVGSVVNSFASDEPVEASTEIIPGGRVEESRKLSQLSASEKLEAKCCICKSDNKYAPEGKCSVPYEDNKYKHMTEFSSCQSVCKRRGFTYVEEERPELYSMNTKQEACEHLKKYKCEDLESISELIDSCKGTPVFEDIGTMLNNSAAPENILKCFVETSDLKDFSPNLCDTKNEKLGVFAAQEWECINGTVTLLNKLYNKTSNGSLDITDSVDNKDHPTINKRLSISDRLSQASRWVYRSSSTKILSIRHIRKIMGDHYEGFLPTWEKISDIHKDLTHDIPSDSCNPMGRTPSPFCSSDSGIFMTKRMLEMIRKKWKRSVKAAFVFHLLVTAHPFVDANCHVARIVYSLMMIQKGVSFPIPDIPCNDFFISKISKIPYSRRNK